MVAPFRFILSTAMPPNRAPTDHAVGQIPVQPWMSAPETLRVLQALTADGQQVRFVGGCVRDSISHRPVTDVDIATPDPPQTVIRLLERAGLRALPTGIEHGTITAVAGDTHFEITTLRIDVEPMGRHARVAYTDDWTADAARRDFTFNALTCTPEGVVYDPFGGIEDLARGHVRFVGNAHERIGEDVLRLLRFFRFHAHYGRPPADRDALAACRQMAPRLRELSGERVREEVRRILLAPAPAEVFILMRGEHVLEHMLPEATDIGRLRAIAWLETGAIKSETIAPDWVRRLAAVMTGGEPAAHAIAQRLRLSNTQTARLAALAGGDGLIGLETDPKALRQRLRAWGAETVRDLVLLAWAGVTATEPRQAARDAQKWQALITAADQWQGVTFPIQGRDVLALGVPAGPEVGAYLQAVEDWWEAGDYMADRAQCLARLRAVVDGRAGHETAAGRSDD